MPLPWEGRKEEEVQKTPEDQAIEQLIPHIRDRLKALFDEGTLRKGDLDLKSIVTLGSLQEPLQVKVMEHIYVYSNSMLERIFLTSNFF